ncbi:Uncharacterised protein [Mycobacteroides abscessus subsp. abscessus]|nr:Uncharacterised protein [Mycobacteroides abscessus subsp. abscessus]
MIWTMYGYPSEASVPRASACASNLLPDSSAGRRRASAVSSGVKLPRLIRLARRRKVETSSLTIVSMLAGRPAATNASGASCDIA